MSKNGKHAGTPVVDLEVHVPKEIPREIAQVLVQQYANVIRTVKPLLPPKDVGELISHALRDMKSIGEFNARLQQSPRGTKFGAGVKRKRLVLAADNADEGVLMTAFAHHDDCKTAADFMHWVTAQALLSSAEVRLVLVLHGFNAVFTEPTDVGEAENDAV